MTISVGDTSSNHWFSRDMLVSRGVSTNNHGLILQVTSHMKRAQQKRNWGSHVDLISQTISGNAAILSETSENNLQKSLPLLLIEEILHQLIGSLSRFTGVYTSQVVQDFFHQQYEVPHTRKPNVSIGWWQSPKSLRMEIIKPPSGPSIGPTACLSNSRF